MLRNPLLPVTSILCLCLFLWSCKSDPPTLQATTQDFAEETSKEYRGPIIDIHAHAFSDDSPAWKPFLDMSYPNPLTGDTLISPATMQEVRTGTFERFEQHNIVKAMVSNGSLWTEQLGDMVVIGENHLHSPDELRALHQQGQLQVIGEVAPNYQGILPTDPSLTPYFDLAVELDIPIAYHLFPGGPPGGAYFAYPKTRAHQGKPLQLEEILIARPNLRIYIMHGGWPYLEDMKALMYAHPQVYIDVAVINWILPTEEFQHFLESLVQSGFGKRIMYGSDQMVWPQTITMGIDAINNADLTYQQKEDIFYNNAARFLQLSEAEISKHKQSGA